MRFDIISIFPDMFDGYFSQSIIGRAQERGLAKIKVYDLRSFTADKRRTVDDAPYGGGAGMILKVEPLHRAIVNVKKGGFADRVKKLWRPAQERVILLSAKGRPWTQKLAREYAKLDRLILVCGRYEGVDERVVDFVDEEISIGDYVLTGGELGAMVIVDSVSRLLGGVLGNQDSLAAESHDEPGLLEYPQYTRPAVFRVGRQHYTVPKVLLDGNHRDIAEWQRRQKHEAKKIVK